MNCYRPKYAWHMVTVSIGNDTINKSLDNADIIHQVAYLFQYSGSMYMINLSMI